MSRLRWCRDADESAEIFTEHTAGQETRLIICAERAEPPYELRPGTGRRGPPQLWARFDAAVAALNVAISGSDSASVADAFGEMSQAAGEVADAVAQEDEAAQRREGGRARGAA